MDAERYEQEARKLWYFEWYCRPVTLRVLMYGEVDEIKLDKTIFPNFQIGVVFFPKPTTRCEGVAVPEGGRERTQGYQLRLETAPVLYRFLIVGVEL